MEIVRFIRQNRPKVADSLDTIAVAKAYEELVMALVLEPDNLNKFIEDKRYVQTSAFDDAISAELSQERLTKWLEESVKTVSLLPASVLLYMRKLEMVIFTLFYGKQGASIPLLRSAIETGEFATRGFTYAFEDVEKRYRSLRTFYKDIAAYKSRFWKLATLRKVIS